MFRISKDTPAYYLTSVARNRFTSLPDRDGEEHQHLTLSTQYSALSTQYSALSTRYYYSTTDSNLRRTSQ